MLAVTSSRNNECAQSHLISCLHFESVRTDRRADLIETARESTHNAALRSGDIPVDVRRVLMEEQWQNRLCGLLRDDTVYHSSLTGHPPGATGVFSTLTASLSAPG